MLKKCIFTWENTKTAMEKKQKQAQAVTAEQQTTRADQQHILCNARENSSKKKFGKDTIPLGQKKKRKRKWEKRKKKKKHAKTKKNEEVLWIKNLPECIFCYPNWQDVAKMEGKKSKQTHREIKIKQILGWKTYKIRHTHIDSCWPDRIQNIHTTSRTEKLGSQISWPSTPCSHFWSDHFAYRSKMAMYRISPTSQSPKFAGLTQNNIYVDGIW